tara:strand:+ start:37 stop:246 length:210 start_codon:yes stop_codon:yes gene_type:complete
MNEPAFPHPIKPSEYGKGMTLRDYFAAKAMAALMTGCDLTEDHYEDDVNEHVAFRAYMIADAMLEARDK